MRKLILVFGVIAIMFVCVACPTPRPSVSNDTDFDSLKVEVTDSVAFSVTDSIL